MKNQNQTIASRQKEESRTDLAAYQIERLQSFKKANIKTKKAGIVFAGDSITEFFPLKKYLGHDLPLFNRGIAGTDSIWLQKHLQEQALTLEPAKIFLMIGINDLGKGYAVSDIVARIVDMIAQIRVYSIGTEIYLLSLLPVNENPQYAAKVKIRKNKNIQLLNQRIQALPGAEYIDLYPSLLDKKGNLAEENTTDGLHLTQEGYRKVSLILKRYL
ncbi:SGNH/GDSL hydrolase family protein [Streptococcus macacae]|uniref:GDSL-like protein n=1 Tax=Streptococcus macacae NCTC 11558 TaxID=764298 RepID=G5JVB6_9STRE|nr:SGNH/GDSL hydrolase family protein [Streptococcus macacae]EHJ51879.1 GDSL-like protein [Streptococcus macacae NCTC 11558]SUN78512.1 lipase/acylhydrolase family protein [Streptococcus macacae NCTC 11558]